MTPDQLLEPPAKQSWRKPELDPPGWSKIEIEAVSIKPFIILVLSIYEVCQLWWLKYVKGGRA